MTMVTESLARRVREAVDAGLVPELGEPIPINRLVHRLHGARWSSPCARARGLRRLVVAALGSRGRVDELEFARRVARVALQTCVPTALRAAAQGHTGAQRERMLQAAERCAREPTYEHALEASAACPAYAFGWAADAADDAATNAGFAAAWAAAAVRAADAAANAAAYAAFQDAEVTYDAYAALYARDAAIYAAAAAIWAAKAAYAAAEAVHGESNDAAARAAYDEVLAEYVERVVSVLIDLRSPGAAYLVQNCDAPHMMGLTSRRNTV